MKKVILTSLLFTGFIMADSSALYSKCVGCHGSNGEKAALGKNTKLIAVSKDDILVKLNGYKKGELNNYGLGSLMKAQVSSLSNTDLEELAVYISKFN